MVEIFLQSAIAGLYDRRTRQNGPIEVALFGHFDGPPRVATLFARRRWSLGGWSAWRAFAAEEVSRDREAFFEGRPRRAPLRAAA
jgi:hypothetical protein